MKDYVKKYAPILQRLIDAELEYKMNMIDVETTTIGHEKCTSPPEQEGDTVHFSISGSTVYSFGKEYTDDSEEEETAKCVLGQVEKYVVDTLKKTAVKSSEQTWQNDLYDRKFYGPHLQLAEYRLAIQATPEAVRITWHPIEAVVKGGKKLIQTAVCCEVFPDYYKNVGVVSY